MVVTVLLLVLAFVCIGTAVWNCVLLRQNELLTNERDEHERWREWYTDAYRKSDSELLRLRNEIRSFSRKASQQNNTEF